jgi:hypothetical protein
VRDPDDSLKMNARMSTFRIESSAFEGFERFEAFEGVEGLQRLRVEPA